MKIKQIRKKIYKVIDSSNTENVWSRLYDWFMIGVIVLSLLPLVFVNSTNVWLKLLDNITMIIFACDYILRLITADFRLKKGKLSFVRYPFTAMAIIDLLSILPSITLLDNLFKLFRIIKLIEVLKVFRVFRAFRYSKNIRIIYNVLRKQKYALGLVGILTVGYIIVTALIIVNIEPETFNNFFKALYWSTISLTTVGYGDIYPVTHAGQVLTMISSFFGLAVVALPAGIVTAGYVEEMKLQREREKKKAQKKARKQFLMKKIMNDEHESRHDTDKKRQD